MSCYHQWFHVIQELSVSELCKVHSSRLDVRRCHRNYPFMARNCKESFRILARIYLENFREVTQHETSYMVLKSSYNNAANRSDRYDAESVSEVDLACSSLLVCFPEHNFVSRILRTKPSSNECYENFLALLTQHVDSPYTAFDCGITQKCEWLCLEDHEAC